MPSHGLAGAGVHDYLVFHLGDLLAGIEVELIQEIARVHPFITPVPCAPEFVRGVLQLRGELVTALDLRMLLGAPATELSRRSRHVVVDLGEERFALLVDEIEDVVTFSRDRIEPSPANLRGFDRDFVTGVLPRATRIVALLDVEKILQTGAAAT